MKLFPFSYVQIFSDKPKEVSIAPQTMPWEGSEKQIKMLKKKNESAKKRRRQRPRQTRVRNQLRQKRKRWSSKK